jgi:hypothetical protein
MTLADLASIGSFLSGIAVLASLIYLSLQVRQSAKHQRSQILDTRTSRFLDWEMRMADPKLTSAWDKVFDAKGGGFTPLEFRQLSLAARALFAMGEQTYFQRQDGLIGDAAYETARKFWATTLATPAMRVLWRSYRTQVAPGYAAEMDAAMARAPAVPPLSFAEFNHLLAEEITTADAPPAAAGDAAARSP